MDDDDLDHMLRAETPKVPPQRSGASRPLPLNLAIAVMLGFAALMIGLPLYLALTASPGDVLWGLAFGDPFDL